MLCSRDLLSLLTSTGKVYKGSASLLAAEVDLAFPVQLTLIVTNNEVVRLLFIDIFLLIKTNVYIYIIRTINITVLNVFLS